MLVPVMISPLLAVLFNNKHQVSQIPYAKVTVGIVRR